MLTSPLASAFLAALLHGATLSTTVRDRLHCGDALEQVATAFSDDVLADGLRARAQAVATPELATEALDLWVPLADAAGLRGEQRALEDASFRTLHPLAYASLAAHDEPLEPVLDRLDDELDGVLHHTDVAARTQGRVKSLYSTWRKMERKGVALDAIHDRVALRIITATEVEARQVLAALHNRYDPIDGAFDDYIATPRPNGYQSLHTAVRTPWGVAEYQVRTEAMHASAASGDQAHWRYKLQRT